MGLMGDARTSGGQPPGAGSPALREDEERGKKPERICSRESTAATSVQHDARALVAARLTSEQASAGGIWGQPAGFGDSREHSAQGCLKGHSQLRSTQNCICLIW